MASNKALLATIISFLLPGLGLLLSKENKVKGVLVFFLVMIADVVSFVVAYTLTLCCIGLFLFMVPVVIHIIAAVHTHDLIVKEEKEGKPIIFT